jgi:glycosyltransferase involved in cell wall biosynthesis
MDASRSLNNKRLNILIIFDDRSYRRDERPDLSFFKQKLERDGLGSEENNFLYVGWSKYDDHIRLSDNMQMLKILCTGGPLLRDLFQYKKFYRAIIKLDFKPDVILIYDFRMMLSAKYLRKKTGGIIAQFMTNLPVSLSMTRKLSLLKGIYYFLIERLFKDVPDIFFAINDTTKNYLLNVGVNNEKIHIFSPNVIKKDLDIINNVKRGEIRKRYNIDENQKIILSVGRLEKEKGFDDLIKNFISLDDKGLVLLIIGEGAEKVFLEEIAEKYISDKRIIFVGRVERDDIWSFYKDSDAFVLLSRSEALGLVFWEAMYMYLPVIGRDVEGIRESVGENEERGLLWHETDRSIEFKNKINESLYGAGKEKRLKAAYEYVNKRLNIPDTTNVIRSIVKMAK